LAAGPFAGLAMSGKVEVKTTNLLLEESTTESNDFSFDDEDRQKRLDYGVSVGVGFQVGSIVLDARYNLGINNITDEDANNNNDNKPVIQTRGLALTVGLKF
jgi:hypothetical protein